MNTPQQTSRNPEPQQIRDLLSSARTIAVVGLSDKPHRDSYRVAAYMQDRGYRIIPVNPAVQSVLGEHAYADLQSIPEPVDVVNIFRKPEAVPPVVQGAIAIGAKAVWMQSGITNEPAAEAARQAGLQVVMDRCIMVEHRRFAG